MEKKLIVAIVLSLAVLLAFQMLSPKKKATQMIQPPAPAVVTGEQPAAAGARVPAQTRAQSEIPGGEGEGRLLPETEEEIQTEQFDLVFSDIGGSLKKIFLKRLPEREQIELLLDEEIPEERPFAMQSSFISGLARKKFQVTRGENMLEYRLIEPEWIEIRKQYTFHKALNQIGLEVFIKNLSSRKINFSYSIVGPSGLKEAGKIAGRKFLQADTMLDGKLWKTKSVKGVQERSGDITWSGLKNRYFTFILKPFTPPRSVSVSPSADRQLTVSFNSRQLEIAPGQEKEDTYLFYAGPLDEKRLEAIGYEFQDVVDYGIFGAVSKVLLSVLRFFHKGTHNWGLAIILMTVLINFILFPLTWKSFSSMHQMKKIQPHMQKLKELHKDNPQKLNKEMMELYKTYNVNPLGGCLPMLLQMPIFIALYQGLMRSIDLKGAHFLWIKDLSRPDAVPLPVTLPFIGSSVNILPLLMVGMMVVQQKISQGISGAGVTDEQASQQKMMMIFFPLFFGFLFYKMPSGLVLYWLTNTILMTAEQGIISRRMSES